PGARAMVRLVAGRPACAARGGHPAGRGAAAGDPLRQSALRARRRLEVRRVGGDLPRFRRRFAQRLPGHARPVRGTRGLRFGTCARGDPRIARRTVRARRTRGVGAGRRPGTAGNGGPASGVARARGAEPVAGRPPRPAGGSARHARRGPVGTPCEVRSGRTRGPCPVPHPRRCGGRAPAGVPRGAGMNRPDPRAQGFDRRHVQRAFSRAAAGYDKASALQRRVEAELVESLEFWPAKYRERVPGCVLDLGSGPGRGAMAMRKRWPKARVLAMDLAMPMLREARRRERWNPLRRGIDRICADARALPLAPGSLDVLFSNLCLQWVDDLPSVLAGFRHALRPGGMLLLSTFGADTLHELRWSFAQADDAPHVSRFVQIAELGDALVHAGFRDPVVDRDLTETRYADLPALMRELRTL